MNRAINSTRHVQADVYEAERSVRLNYAPVSGSDLKTF